MNKTVLCAALAAGMLTACGGSDDPSGKLAPGEEFTVELSLDDTLAETSTYRAYGISRAGRLVTTDGDLASDSLIPIEISRTGMLPKTVDASDLQAFFAELWPELAKRHSTQDASRIAREVHDLDVSLATLYQNYRNSGLDLAAFVDFYEVLDNYPALDKNGMAESELSEFLAQAQATPRQWLDALHAHGSSWGDFLALMDSRKDDFNGLYQQYGAAGLDLAAFTGAYLQVNGLNKADKADSGIEVAKFVWQVIKDNRPQTEATGAFTRALSTQDKNWQNYGNSRSGASQAVTLKAKNLFGMTLYEVRFALSGYYGARHERFEGQWLPLLNLDVQKMSAIISWKVNATARVTLPVNVGTVAAPVPEMPLFMDIKQSGLLQNYTDKYQFRANGQSGFVYVKKF